MVFETGCRNDKQKKPMTKNLRKKEWPKFVQDQQQKNHSVDFQILENSENRKVTSQVMQYVTALKIHVEVIGFI